MHLFTQLQADKLQICQFVDSLVHQYEIVGVIRRVEMLDSVLLSERRMHSLELTIPARQVNICFSVK